MYHYVYVIYNTVEHKAYFGVRSSNLPPKEDITYMSSSKLIKKLYKEDPSNFEKKILKTFETRKEAIEYEIYLHDTYDVAVNPSFYNKAKQTSIGFDMTGTVAYNRAVYIEGTIGDNGLTLLKEDGLDKHRKRLGIFSCICGSTFRTSILSVKLGKTKSCGCRKVENGKSKNIKYLPNQIIGDYGIYYIQDVFSPNKRKALFLCTCGNTFTSIICDVKLGKTKSCGCRRFKNKEVLF